MDEVGGVLWAAGRRQGDQPQRRSAETAGPPRRLAFLSAWPGGGLSGELAMHWSLRRIIMGRPFETARSHEERLTKLVALPIFASDALSSSAYATEEILFALMLAGTAAFVYSLPIAIAIVVLLVIVAVSYRQVVLAYPSGGGAYVVSKENLGVLPGTTAAAALCVDYVLTVSVSVAAGVAAITSAVPELRPYTV